MSELKTRIVTPTQFEQGWVEKIYDRVVTHRFTKIRTLEDGNILVREPELTSKPLDAREP